MPLPPRVRPLPLQGASPTAGAADTRRTPGSRRSSSSASLQASASLSLHGPQETIFKELDALLSESPHQSGETESLLAEIGAVLDGTKRGQQTAAALETWLEVASEQQAAPKCTSPKDGLKLFEELESLMRDGGEGQRRAAAAISPMQQEVRRLLSKVASDGELLAKMYPLHEPAEEPAAASREPRPQRKATPEEEEKAALFDELDRILRDRPELAEQHKELAANHAARIAKILDEHGQKHRDTRQVANNLLNGVHDDETNASAAHRSHLDWHRNTMAMIQTQKGLGATRAAATFGGPFGRSASAAGLGRAPVAKGRLLTIPAKGPQGQVLRDGNGHLQMMTIAPRKR